MVLPLCRFVPAKMNNPDAVNFCLSQEAHLVEVGSQEEQDSIYQFLEKTDKDQSFIWIGLSDSTSKGDFVLSSSGKIPIYINWGLNEPNYNGNEDCVQMHIYGKWNDRSCSTTFHAFCEK